MDFQNTLTGDAHSLAGYIICILDFFPIPYDHGSQTFVNNSNM
jgi:hypothetical protein